MNWRRFLLIGTPYFWLLAFFLVPFGIVLRLALSDAAIAIPPNAAPAATEDGSL